MKKLIRNRAQCAHCKEIIESKSGHDWVCCSCFSNKDYGHGIFVDGGLNYQRYGMCQLNDFIDLSEWEEENEK